MIESLCIKRICIKTYKTSFTGAFPIGGAPDYIIQGEFYYTFHLSNNCFNLFKPDNSYIGYFTIDVDEYFSTLPEYRDKRINEILND